MATTHSLKKGKWVENIECPFPDCGSSDAMAVYDKGTHIDGYCNSCSRYTRDPYGIKEDSQSRERMSGEGISKLDRLTNKGLNSGSMTYDTVSASSNRSNQVLKVDLEDGLTHPIRALVDRGLTYATAEYFNVRVGVSSTDGETPIYTLFPRYRDGEQVGWKCRDSEKRITNSGGSNVDLFGAHLCKPTGKKIWITEGEIDCLSVYQSLKENSTIKDWEPAVVSVPDGATSAVASISRSLDLLNGYDEIILVFDNDPAGKDAVKEVCKVLAGKVSYVKLPMKDPNEMVMAGKSIDLKWLCLSHAKKYQPDGIVSPADMWDRYKAKQDNVCYTYPSFLPQLQQMTCGPKDGSIITVTGGTGTGKTDFLLKVLDHLKKTTNEKIAGVFLESDVVESNVFPVIYSPWKED